ncbi:hypothetical protein H4R27_002642 [Coemansia aciculifera]|nr:hypothetical protein H4R27_002642 [Coemansia aciculifera]
MNTPAFLIKDVWTTSGGGSAGDTHEISFLNVLHAEFDKSSELSSSFSRLVSTGSVYINRGGTLVADSTATAFAGLPSITQGATKGSGDIKGLSSSNAQRLSSSKAQRSSTSSVRQHRRTVTKWAGNMVSEADNQSQVVIAVADAMVALNAAYAKCKILHGSISNRAILLQKTVNGIKGVLADFDYASYARDGAGAAEAPELKLFQSIRCLEDPGAVRTATDIADHKRLHMTTERTFRSNILLKMRNGPLRLLTLDMYRALFLHPGCYGVTLVTNDELAEIGDGDIRDALHAVPVVNDERDPLVLRLAFVDTIVANLLEVLARHRDVALAALNAAAANIAGGAEEGAGV